MAKRKLEDYNDGQVTQKQLNEAEERARVAEQKLYNMIAARKGYSMRFSVKNTYRFALSSDWHVGSLYHNADALQAFYKTGVEEGITDFYCAGDILDGYHMYRGQEFELSELGFSRQFEALMQACAKFPKEAVTHFITGNHDASFLKSSGVSVGERIAAEIPNMNWLGQDIATIILDLPARPLRFALLHPDGGTALSLSYKPQRIVDAWAGGEKPHILGIGHYHKAEFMPRYRNVKILQAGTLCDQTSFMARKGLDAHVGGWFVEIKVGKLVNRIKAEFVEFF